MAEVLEYIQKQIENLEVNINDDQLLRSVELYELIEHIGKNPTFIHGGINKYRQNQYPLEELNTAQYGISEEFLYFVKDEAKKQHTSLKDQIMFFTNTIIAPEGMVDKDIIKGLEKIYKYGSFKKLVKAVVNKINYLVLNNFADTANMLDAFTKCYNNITYKSLPVGQIATFPSAILQTFQEDINTKFLKFILNYLSPKGLNFTNLNVDNSTEIINCVYNKEENHIVFNNINSARGIIKNKNLQISLPAELDCTQLGIETETDSSYFSTLKTPNEIIKEATTFKLGAKSGNVNKCSTEELNFHSKELELINNLESNSDFVKVKEVEAELLLRNIVNFHKLSQNFNDSKKGKNAITLKLYFDKQNDVFVNLRSNDLFLALFCANFSNTDKGLVNIFYKPNSQDIYIVNLNKQQYGYCQSLSQTEMSNCEHTIYIQLLQKNFTIQDKYRLFTEENVLPLVVENNVVKEISGLEDALARQNKLLFINDNEIFYDLFLRNIVSYVYSYATQIEKDGKLKWQLIKNNEWGTGRWEQRGVEWQWSQPNYDYIYKARESFWDMNSDITIRELLAFFVSKGGNKLDNSIYYRKLCQEILGVDYYPFSNKLVPILLDEGLLCIEDLEFDPVTQSLKGVKYSYRYEYVSDNVYKKLENLNNNLSANILKLYGEYKGSQYIDFQTTILEQAKPKTITFGNKNKTRQLLINIHNPIFYNEKEGYVSRIAEQRDILRGGKLIISTNDKVVNDISIRYKPIRHVVPNAAQRYEAYQEDWAGVKNHLTQFREWLEFGPGGSEKSKEYITEEMIIQGYVFPLSQDGFVPKYIMPYFQEKEATGKTIKVPLSFIGKNIPFEAASIYSKTTKKSFLTQKSRANLIKVGLIEKKDKIPGYLEDVMIKGKMTKKPVKVTPITEEEGKKIYKTLVARYNKLESEIKLEGDALFSIFCQRQLEPSYKDDIQYLWNSTYNNMAIPDYPKFPVFCKHSRWFGNYGEYGLFSFRTAQIEGMKFVVSGANAGLLAHEVGFGKTTTAIALMSHMNLTGESSRNIMFTPPQVYYQFYDAIKGGAGKLGLLGADYNVVMLKNARKDALKAVKTYTTQEEETMETFSTLAKEGILDLDNLPAKQAHFWTNFPLIVNRKKDSDVQQWYDNFMEILKRFLPDLQDIPAVSYRLMSIQEEINKGKKEINKELNRFKKEFRYSKGDFTSKKIPFLDKRLKKWYKEILKDKRYRDENNTLNRDMINEYEFPLKRWLNDVDEALDEKRITPTQARKIKDDEQKGIKWDGTLTERGFSEMKKLDTDISNRFYKKRGANIKGGGKGRITLMLNAISEMLIDDLGKYKPEVMKPNTIILCNHQAVKRFNVSPMARTMAQKYISNVDDIRYVEKGIRKRYDELSFNAISMQKLAVTGVVVDEIHNYNNLVKQARTHVLSYMPKLRDRGSTKDFFLTSTVRGSAFMDKLPDGSGINVNKGYLKGEGAYKLKYNSRGAASLKSGPTNLLSIVFQAQLSAKSRGVKQKNSILLSATPFTDNVFQMFTVLGMTNYDKMKEANMEKVFNFFITYVKEEWRFNITHKNEFGLFAEIQGYYNTKSMSNFIKSFAHFKVYDEYIESRRPKKYMIPQEVKQDDDQAGSNTSVLNYSPYLEGISSYIELSDIQKEIIGKISDFVEGKIDSPYELCPEQTDSITITEEGEIDYATPEIKELMLEVNSLKEKALESHEDKIDYYDQALAIIDDLYSLPENADNKILAYEYNLLTTLVDGTEEQKEEIKEDDIITSITDYADVGFIAQDQQQVVRARAILAQSFGQSCVLSPYFLKCDKEAELENILLKDYPLDKNNMTKTAKNFVEQSPKIKYAIECALNTIKWNAGDGNQAKAKSAINGYQIGGQIIYLNKGKNFKYGGNYYNAYSLVKRYIVDLKFEYFDEREQKVKIIGPSEIAVITGGMSQSVKKEDPNNPGQYELDNEGKIITQSAREEIRDKFNDGRVKILLGSSAIKEGIDLHKKSHTLYILDADFSPSNAMQLEGRIWRQGNMWKNVRIVYVLGRDSIDAFVYSKLQQKIGEIKEMLESGVYELDKTQFTINAKERIKRIISDKDQLVELNWQDRKDSLDKEKNKLVLHKTRLLEIKKEYKKFKPLFNQYVVLLNKLYQVLLENEKQVLAKSIKIEENQKLEHKYRLKIAKATQNLTPTESKKWRENNLFKPITNQQALDLVETKIKKGQLRLRLQNIEISQDTDMTIINEATNRISEFIKEKGKPLLNLFEPLTRAGLFSAPTSEQSSTTKFGMVLFTFKEWVNLDHIKTYLNTFAEGGRGEIILSNYMELVANVGKTKGKNPTYYSFEDIPDIMSKVDIKISKIQTAFKSELKWKKEEWDRVALNQANIKKVEGESLSQLIDSFQKSMNLLITRKNK